MPTRSKTISNGKCRCTEENQNVKKMRRKKVKNLEEKENIKIENLKINRKNAAKTIKDKILETENKRMSATRRKDAGFSEEIINLEIMNSKTVGRETRSQRVMKSSNEAVKNSVKNNRNVNVNLEITKLKEVKRETRSQKKIKSPDVDTSRLSKNSGENRKNKNSISKKNSSNCKMNSSTGSNTNIVTYKICKTENNDKEKNITVENKNQSKNKRLESECLDISGGTKTSGENKTVKLEGLKQNLNREDGRSEVSKTSILKTPVRKKFLLNKEDIKECTLFDFKPRRKSTRVSYLKNKDVYEFQHEGNGEHVVKKKPRRRVQSKRKKVKPSFKLTLLTTDPMFESLSKPIPVSTFYSSKKMGNGSKKLPTSDENPPPETQQFDHLDSHSDIVDDDDGYEASVSGVNETAGTCTSLADPSSSSVYPTPVVNSRFPGTASTPRVDNESMYFNPFYKLSLPISNKEQVKSCFGFDEESVDNGIGLSPVKKTNHLSQLHAVGMSTFCNIEEIEPVPTRFPPSYFKKPDPVRSKENTVHLKEKRPSKRHTKNNLSSSLCKHSGKKLAVDAVKTHTDESNKSVLFDIDIDSDILVENDNKAFPPVNMSANILQEKNVPTNIPSPEKSFSKPPKRSYDRSSLEAPKKRFLKNYGGKCPSTDTEDEGCDVQNEYVTKRRKKISANPRKKLKTYRNKGKKKEESKENRTPPPGGKQKLSKKSRKNMDKTFSNWASDINSHFSEIEEIPLVIE